MKNLRIVGQGNTNKVSTIDTLLLKKLLDCYKRNLMTVESSKLVDEHIDKLRKHRMEISKVVELNREFNDLQIFHEMLYHSDGDFSDFEINNDDEV